MLHLLAFARQTSEFSALKLQKQTFQALLPKLILCISGALFGKGLRFYAQDYVAILTSALHGFRSIKSHAETCIR